MRNFNNEDLEKYEKMTKNAVDKFKTKVKYIPKIPPLKLSTILAATLCSGLLYLGYRIYDYRKYRASRYVDLFQWKSTIAANVQTQDLIDKISHFNLDSQDIATDKYEKYLKEEFGKMVEKIKEKKTYRMWQSKSRFPENQNQKGDKNSNKSSPCELILSKSGKSKLDLGYLFKLHTKQYITTLSNNGQIGKKTFIYPVTLFNVPIYVTKKQQIKKVSRKTKLGDLIAAKAKFELGSECQKVNYWNLFVLPNASNKTTKKSIVQGEQATYQTEGTQKSRDSGSVYQTTKKSRQEILFECRRRVKIVEETLVEQLKHTVNEAWLQNEQQNY